MKITFYTGGYYPHTLSVSPELAKYLEPYIQEYKEMRQVDKDAVVNIFVKTEKDNG